MKLICCDTIVVQMTCALNSMLSEVISHYLFNENTDICPIFKYSHIDHFNYAFVSFIMLESYKAHLLSFLKMSFFVCFIRPYRFVMTWE